MSFWSAPSIMTSGHTSPKSIGCESLGESRTGTRQARSNTKSPQFTDFPSPCACLESSLTNLSGSGLNLLCLQSHSELESHRTYLEVVILGTNQMEPSLWGQECLNLRALPFCARRTDARGQESEGSGVKNC